MVVWGLSNITDALQKRLCRFLIHRYLSDFLKSSINLEQLSATLYGGVASVSDVDMDVQRINDAFESMKIPFTAVEGYIGEVNITVPWQYILIKSVDLEIKQLQLTLQLQQFSDESPGDIVASMFGSVAGSLATSMELAQSFMNKEKVMNEEEDKGVEQFAEVIDAVISRFRLIFIDATIRLEGNPDPESGLCAALELGIDWIELVDEQLESDFGNGAITSQPHSLSSVPDFNKLFHVKGIRLYTDIFTKPEMRNLEENMSASAQVITSMYLRREKEKTKKKLSASSESSEEHYEKRSGGLLCSMQSTADSTIYESCYSQHSCIDDSFSSTTFSVSHLPNSTILESNPILFASFSGSVETVVVRVRNTEISSQGVVSSEKEINLNFDGLCFFLTPSQLSILKSFFTAIAKPSSNPESQQCSLGKPMCVQDYQQVEAELQTRITPSSQAAADFQHGNWGGSMMFYDAQRRPSVTAMEEHLANVSLNVSDTRADETLRFTKEISGSDSSSKTRKILDTVSDVITVKASISNVLLVLTHKDHLGQDEVRNRAAESIDNIAAMISSYKEIAEGFFKLALSVRLGVQMNELRQNIKHLYRNDHLRFVGEGVSFEYSHAKGQDEESLSMNIEAVDADLFEILSASSSSTGVEEHIKLFSFCDSAPPSEKIRRLILAMRSSNLQHYTVNVNLANCESELDISIIDRISSLLVTRPFHTYPFSSLRNANDVSRGLKTDLLFTAMQDASSPSSTLTLTFCCPEWDMKLRIPVTDLRLPDPSLTQPPHWKRHLHKEILRITLHDVKFEFPAFSISRLGQYGTVIISASALNGFFDLNEKSDLTGLSSLFLHAHGSEACDGNRISLKLCYDNRNTSLKSTAACYNVADCTSHHDAEGEANVKVEGPFSKCIIRNENRMVIVVGSTKEMYEFGESCISKAKISCELTLPVLRVYLPNRHYYEVIYNRLANDLALWQPSSPVFSSCERQRDLEGSDDSLFQLCRSDRRASMNSESNVSCSHHSTLTTNALCSEKSHDFCLLANIEDGRLLIGTEFKIAQDEVVGGKGQVGAVLLRTQLMVVNGFHGIKELSYIYSTSKITHLFHKNLIADEEPYEQCVLKKDFAEHSMEEIQAEPVMDEEICSIDEEDNFAVAVRIDFNFTDNIKNVLVGIGIRNTNLHLRPYQNAEQFWVNQMIGFLDITDYGIPGYELPQITTQFHVHLSSSVLKYEHSFVSPSSPLLVQVVLGSCNISSRIVEELELYKFECIFEQLKIFASFNHITEANKILNDSKKCEKIESKSIQVLSVGMLQLEVTTAKNFGCAHAVSANCAQFLEVRCKNDLLKVWVCSDSLCLIINALAELLNAHTIAKGAVNTTNSQLFANTTSNVDCEQQNPTEEQLRNLEKLVRSAVSNPVQDFNRKNGMVHKFSSQNMRKDQSDLLLNAIQDLNDTAGRCEQSDSSGALAVYEGFCLIDEIPGSGIIMAGSGKPRARFLSIDNAPVIYDNYLKNTDERSDIPILLAVNNSHIPLVKYCIDDVSLELHLYGGNDFGSSKPLPKPYSVSNGEKSQRLKSPAGGYYRDYSSHVELHLSKIKFVFEMFSEDAPALSTMLFSIGSVEILDKMMSSKINKLLYPHVCEQSFPRNSQSPVFSIRLYETPLHEGKMKVSLLPLRINADQDTLEFLEDFVNDLSEGVVILRPEDVETSGLPEKPILEMNCTNTESSHCTSGVEITRLKKRMDCTVHNNVYSDRINGHFRVDYSSEHNLESFSPSDLLPEIYDDIKRNEGERDSIDDVQPESTNNSFSKRVAEDSDSITEEISNFVDSLDSLSPSTNNVSKEELHISSEAKLMPLSISTSSEQEKGDEKLSHEQQEKNLSETSSRVAESVGRGKIYFKEFTFSPSTVIRLDFTGKRMRPDQGWILGFLVGLSDFKCTEIRLKELNCSRGLLGYDRCAKFALKAWLKDINNKQLAQFVTTYGPIKCVVEVGLGIRDLFLMPVNEYCKEGHVVKGLQRGAESFGISTATAAVDMLQRMVIVVQSVAELAFDIVSPESPLHRRRKKEISSTVSRLPNDIRAGISMALEDIGQELSDTAEDLQLAAQDRLYGYSAMRGLLRQAPTTVIRPIVAMSRATAHILDGLRNQMKPDSYREEMEKWKK